MSLTSNGKPLFSGGDKPKHDPYILLHPNIPKPLHGIAPRVVLGSKWWEGVKKTAKIKAREHCMACGVWFREAKYHQWLECHEMYIYDWNRHTLTYDRTVAICHSCHAYIHSGKLSIMLEEGEITEEKYDDIMDHGDDITKNCDRDWHGFKPTNSRWSSWRMVIKGKRYGPSTRSPADWAAGKWREWKP